MSKLIVEAIHPSDPRMLDFRRSIICEDNGLNEEVLYEDLHLKEIQSRFPQAETEEVYKFSNRKWNATPFARIYACFVEDKIASIAGCQEFSPDYLRVCMHYYTLKKFRQQLWFPLWTEGGFIHQAERDFQGRKALFFGIYEHNRKLSALVRVLKEKRGYHHLSRSDESTIRRMQSFECFPERISFRNVEQTIFYQPLVADFKPEHLLAAIQSSN